MQHLNRDYAWEAEQKEEEKMRQRASAAERERLAILGGRDYNDMNVKKQLLVDQSLLLHNIELFTALGSKADTFRKTINLTGEPAGMLNKLLITPGAGDFIQLKPHEISELIPMIRIFKVLYDEEGEVEKEIEFKFPTRPDHSPHMKETEDMLADSTDTGVGIKSFEYKYIGSNPATVRNDIEAKLILYFQNFSEMLRPRYAADGTKYAYIDLFDRARKLIESDPEWLTEILETYTDVETAAGAPASPGSPVDWEGEAAKSGVDKDAFSCDNPKNLPERREYKSVEFEIKAMAGWAWTDSGGSSIQSAAAKKAIKNSVQSFFLTLIDHDFAFEDDGTFTLELNYRARLSGILVSPKSDILNLENGEALHESSYTKIKWWATIKNLTGRKAGDSHQKLAEDIATETFITANGSWATIWRAYKDKLKELQGCCEKEEEINLLKERFNEFKASIRSKKFRMMMEGMINGDKVYTFTVPPPVIAAMTGGDPTASRLVTASVVRAGVIPTQTEGGSLEVEKVLLSFETSEQWDAAMTTPSTVTPDGYSMAYMFLGDLIDLAATMALDADSALLTQTAATINPEIMKKLKVLLGSIEIQPEGAGALPIIIPLADLPISLKNFRHFWFKKVIEPQRETYALLHFIRDIVRDLIINSINSPYYSFSPKTMHQKLKFKSATISLPQAGAVTAEDTTLEAVEVDLTHYDEELAAIYEEQGMSYIPTPVMQSEIPQITTTDPMEAWMIRNGGNAWTKRQVDLDAVSAAQPLVPLNPYLKINEMYHYLVIYVENGSMNYMKKSNIPKGMTRRNADWEKGIYHFGFGEDRGILISAKFNKTQQPFLREARYMEDGYNPMQQLSNVYDVDITLFGAPFFYPGQYIWLSPYGLSKGKHSLGPPDLGCNALKDYSGASYANIMGLGGYHIITEVHGILEDGKYHTNLKARYDNSGADHGERQGFGMQDDDVVCPEPE